jgi:hypothetical protein
MSEKIPLHLALGCMIFTAISISQASFRKKSTSFQGFMQQSGIQHASIRINL